MGNAKQDQVCHRGIVSFSGRGSEKSFTIRLLHSRSDGPQKIVGGQEYFRVPVGVHQLVGGKVSEHLVGG